MIFNPWRKYPRHKPKEWGWYQCTYKLDDDPGNTYVMDLYYTPWKDEWIDKRRRNVFDGYQVFKASRATTDENRVMEDTMCDRTLGVIAWRKLPRPFGVKREKRKKKRE